MDVREKSSNEKWLIDVNDIYSLFNQNGIARLHVADIDTIQRVDAVEVVHGRWRCHGDCGVTECSVCGWSIEEYVGDYAYCPNCGAKMDGGTN